MDAIPNNIEQRRRIVHDHLLIWLDESMDEINKDYKHILTQTQTGGDNVNFFTQRDECIDFLSDREDIKSFLVVENTIAQQIMPLISDIPQLNGVYIFNSSESLHEEWTTKWQKIKSVHTNIDDMCEALQSGINTYNQDSIAMSFLTVNEVSSTANLNQLDPTFMYTQLFKEILLNLKHNSQATKDFVTYCRQNNSGSAINIDRFEKEYHAKSPIWWYTHLPFIYSMLNYGLRTMDADIIITMGFFLRDVHGQIQQLYEQQVSSYGSEPFLVYRGQGLMKSDFEKLQKTKGGLISFNNFLSTSTDKNVSIGFAHGALGNEDMVGILFIISIDPSVKSVPFASIKKLSYFQEENEILFSMHTIFRVGAINVIDNNNQLYQITLQLTSDDDQQLRLLTDRIREEASGDTGWKRLGKLLLKIGQFNKAEELYNVLLEQTSDESKKAIYYICLGSVKNGQGDYEKAIWYHEQGLEIYEKTLPSNHPELAGSYGNIGIVYSNMGEYSKALSFYEKALHIRQKTLPSSHPDLARSYNDIGVVYNKLREYSKSLSFYEKTLKIFQETLPSNHPLLATSCINIGMLYFNMGEYSKALSFYEKALEIQQKSLPSNHPDLATSYNNIACVYDNMGEYSKALSFYEKVLEIQQKSLSSNHPSLATSYNNIGSVYVNMGEYSKALSSLEKALEIREKSLPSSHPSLASSYNNIGNVYDKMGEYSKALSFYEKSLEIREKSLPSNHPDLATSYNNIGSVYHNMGKHSKALSYYEKALEIHQKSLPSNHPDLATSYNNIGNAYNKVREYSKALSFYEKSLEIQQKSLPSNHTSLASLYNNIGSVYDNMGEYLKALLSHQQALEIRQKTLPSNHPLLATSYSNIGCVYCKIGEYSKGLSYFERALDIFQRALPLNHPHIKSVKQSIENVKHLIKNSY